MVQTPLIPSAAYTNKKIIRLPSSQEIFSYAAPLLQPAEGMPRPPFALRQERFPKRSPPGPANLRRSCKCGLSLRQGGSPLPLRLGNELCGLDPAGLHCEAASPVPQVLTQAQPAGPSTGAGISSLEGLWGPRQQFADWNKVL